MSFDVDYVIHLARFRQLLYMFHFAAWKLCRNWFTNAFASCCLITSEWILNIWVWILYDGLQRLCNYVTLQYFKHIRPVKNIPIFERFPILFSVIIIWLYAVILTSGGAYNHRPIETQHSCRTDKANIIETAPWFVSWVNRLFHFLMCIWQLIYGSFRFMFPYPTQWGAPTFSVGHVVAMMSAVLVSMVEVIVKPSC